VGEGRVLRAVTRREDGADLVDQIAPGAVDCRPILDVRATEEWRCAETGVAAIGASCELDDCVAGAECFSGAAGADDVCRRLCDANHPCPAPETCRLIPGLRNQGGSCR
jgi:hypothetical protein